MIAVPNQDIHYSQELTPYQHADCERIRHKFTHSGEQLMPDELPELAKTFECKPDGNGLLRVVTSENQYSGKVPP